MANPPGGDPGISVIIPTYNRAGIVARAILSALMQCLAGDEIIVVDDGSTDRTRGVVAAFGSQVRYVHAPNGGAGKARNLGLKHATKPLVAFLDSDDEWMAGKLAMQRRLMQMRPDILFSFSNFAVTLKNGQPLRHYLRHWLTTEPFEWHEALGPAVPFSSLAPVPAGGDDVPVHVGDLAAAEMVDNYIFTSTLVVRREEAGDALSFAEDLKIFEDWYCFARLALRGMAAYLDWETAWQHGAAADRVSNAGSLMRAEAWHALDERIWSTDPEFRRRHATLYERTLKKKRLALARGLIAAGRTGEARGILAELERVPLSYQLLSWLPGPLLRSATATRRHLACLANSFSQVL